VTAAPGAEGAKLVRMANQIAAFFRSYPEATAQEGIRGHLLSFWTPRMLQDLCEHEADTKVDSLVRRVIVSLRTTAKG
jgi:formate dehydrogenase subunit delta